MKSAAAIVTAIVLAPLVTAPARAQQAAARSGVVAPTPPASIAAMHRLDFLLGEWDGDGWIIMGRGERRTFHQHELVRAAAGGTVVVVDGLGKSTVAGQEGVVVHQAFAIASYDSAATAFRWRAFRATGDETLATPAIGDGTLTWGMGIGPDGRGGHVRFTITVTPAGEWHEVGDFLAPGAASDAPGARFFEMTLKRRS